MALGSDLLLRLLINAEDNTGPAVRSAREGINSISVTAEKVYSALSRYLTFQVAIQGGGELVRLADQYNLLNARLKIVSGSQSEANQAFKALFGIAQDTGSELESVIGLYARTNKAVTDLTGSQQDTLTLNRLLQQSFQLSGQTTAESAQSTAQLVQGLQSGVLAGDEFRSVMEGSPRVVQALTDSLGVNVGALRGMAEGQKLTSAIVIQSLLSQADAINAQYQGMPPTVEKAFTRMNNALLAYVGEVNNSWGATTKLADGVTYLSKHVEDVADIVGIASLALTGKFVAGLTASASASMAAASAAKEKALADRAATQAVTQLSQVNALTATETARAAEATAAEALARKEAALAANENRQATLLEAQATTEAAAAIEAEVVALGSAVAAARERLAASKTVQATVEAEAELSAAVQAEAEFQWKAEAAAVAHTNALAKQLAVEADATAATLELAAADKALAESELAAAAASGRAADAQRKSRELTGNAMEGMAGKAGKAELAMKGLNAVLLAPIVYEAGTVIGDWLADKFENFRLAGVALAQGITELGVVWDVFTGKLTASQGKEELKKIADGYAEVAADATDAGRKALEAADQQSTAVQQAATAQQEALDKSTAKLKAATTLIDAEFARQTAAGDQALSARLAQIAASGDAENVQAQKNAVAERQASADRLLLIADYGSRRLAAISAQLGTQAEIEKQGEVVRKAAEQASLQARIDAYGDLAKAYSGVVDQLQGQWQREMQLFNQGTEGIKALERDVEQQILGIRRSAMDEKEKLRSQEAERDAAIGKLRAEQAKGAQADEKELNRLFGDASKLIGQVNDANQSRYQNDFEKSAEARKNEGLLQGLWDGQKKVLEDITAQHKANADVLLPSLEQAKGKLAEVNTALGEMDRQLAASKELKITLDPGSVSAAQSTINELTAPATKTITVVTVNAGAAAAPDGQPPQGHMLGGLIRRFATGGKLPGYGGGDTVPTLLEPGEYIVNKQATAQALPLLEAINKGTFTLPGFATGGQVPNSSGLASELNGLVQKTVSGQGMSFIPESTIDDLMRRISASGEGNLMSRVRELSRANKAIKDFVQNIGSSVSQGATGFSVSQLITQNARNQDAQNWIKRLAGLGNVRDAGPSGIVTRKSLGQQATSQINAAVDSIGGLGGGGVPSSGPAPQGMASRPAASGAASGLAPIVIMSRDGGKQATVYGDQSEHKQLVDLLKFHSLTS